MNNLLYKGRKFINKITGLDQIKIYQVNNYCNTILNKLQFKTYLPLSTFSLNSYCIAYILNDVIINNRKTIIEFGSGFSSIYLARLAQTNNIKLEIVSVDEDKAWLGLLNEILIKEKLEDQVKFILAPITSKDSEYTWYDTKILNLACKDKKFDMIVVDGPKVQNKDLICIREHALYFLKNNLESSFVVFLDDLYRIGENKIIKKWEKDFNIDFKIKNSIAIGYSGNHFISDPI